MKDKIKAQAKEFVMLVICYVQLSTKEKKQVGERQKA